MEYHCNELNTFEWIFHHNRCIYTVQATICHMINSLIRRRRCRVCCSVARLTPSSPPLIGPDLDGLKFILRRTFLDLFTLIRVTLVEHIEQHPVYQIWQVEVRINKINLSSWSFRRKSLVSQRLNIEQKASVWYKIFHLLLKEISQLSKQVIWIFLLSITTFLPRRPYCYVGIFSLCTSIYIYLWYLNKRCN